MRRIALAVMLVVLGVGLLVGVRAGEERTIKVEPVSALVVPVGADSVEGVGRTTAIRITDRSKLEKLESFFPGYRGRPASDRAGGWEAGYRVYFDFPRGETVRVTVSKNGNGKSWTVGSGDFRTQGEFEAFVKGL